MLQAKEGGEECEGELQGDSSVDHVTRRRPASCNASVAIILVSKAKRGRVGARGRGRE